MWFHGESNNNASIIVLWLASWLKTTLMTWWQHQWAGPHVPFQIQITLAEEKSRLSRELWRSELRGHKSGLTWTVRLPHWCGMACRLSYPQMSHDVSVVSVGSAARVGSCVALGTTNLAFPQLWNDRLDEITWALWFALWQGTVNLADELLRTHK